MAADEPAQEASESAPPSLPEPANGVAYPQGWQDWALVSVSHRTDNATMRVILGNDTAIEAIRAGQTNPWPEGSVLGKVVWKAVSLADWSSAQAPGTFVHAEFMFKGEGQADTGWRWARWVGEAQTPYQLSETECVACHSPVKGRDWVFTTPAPLP
ncbi:cytochrome P460 family protein [Ferrimonas balearica]|nr:cytochrome P460 family protein [Ferrimonas balearica]